MSTNRQLTCTCCGGDAGRWQQHWNQDTGYGLCPGCRDWIWNRGTKDRDEFERTYGKPGTNYAPWPAGPGPWEAHRASRPQPGGDFYVARATRVDDGSTHYEQLRDENGALRWFATFEEAVKAIPA